MPPIKNCISNKEPSEIDTHGFVEISGVLGSSLIESIYQDAVRKVVQHKSDEAEALTELFASSPKKRKRQGDDVEVISNALQVDLSSTLLQKVEAAVRNCDITATAMKTVFGKKDGPGGKSNYDGFVIETPKVLVAEPGSPPQIPHADDHCSSALFCIVHLQDGQESTCVAKYDKTKDYPTGLTVICEDCEREEQLSDEGYRRGLHLTSEEWHCGHCDAPQPPKDQPNVFETNLVQTFGELLEEGAPNLCDAYAGGKTSNTGEGILGLPMLIHRGPGNPSWNNKARYVLFYTLRPVYRNAIDADNQLKYNVKIQIHASCVLFNLFKKVRTTYAGTGSSLDNFVDSVIGDENDELKGKNEELELQNNELGAENRRLQKEIERLRRRLSSGSK